MLSDSIKNTYTGQLLFKVFKNASLTGIGQHFPSIPLMRRDNKRTFLQTRNGSEKYIFLDFWFSHCGPCISQFEALKSTYNKFKTKGFEIISISTDKKSDESGWKNAIDKYNLPWKHFWDIDGKESNKLSIDSFPTNFLLDQNGKVIAKNISPSQLNMILSKKL